MKTRSNKIFRENIPETFKKLKTNIILVKYIIVNMRSLYFHYICIRLMYTLFLEK